MTFTDYPGHLVAAVLVLASAVLAFAIFRAGPLQTPERRRYRWLLMTLHYAVLLALLAILWNPSMRRTREVFGRNTVLALFDTSESMSIADDGRLARLDKALERFTRHFHPDDEAGPTYTLYGFDRQAYYSGSADLLRRWGSASDLHAVLSLISDSGRQGADAAAHETPAGVVIFTDGRADDGDLRRYLPLPESDLPMVLVGVGSRRSHPDIAVVSLDAPANAWVDMPFIVTAAVKATGMANHPAKLELLCDGNVIDSCEVGPDWTRTAEAAVEFTVLPQPLGPHVFTVRAAPDRGEINQANNARSACVEVMQERSARVLLYSQWASFDIGKIRQALAWDQRVRLDLGFDVIKDPALVDRASLRSGGVKLPERTEDLFAYDVIILGPVDVSELTTVQRDGLYRFVAERGGGLLLLPGRTVASLAGWSDARAETLLPVLFDREHTRLWPPQRGAVNLTFEARVGRLFDPNVAGDATLSLAPYYRTIEAKPAATTFVTAGGMPVVTAHRLGRGRVCLLNASKLFMLYREDRQGGALGELMSGLVTWLARTPAQGAGMELFVERAGDDPQRLEFSAYVVDETYAPAAGANVLLTAGEHVVPMEPTGEGYYRAALDWGGAPSVVATVQAEVNGSFLGERTVAVSLPPLRDEMSCIDLDEPFLRALARQVGARYVHIDELDDKAAQLFVPRHQAGTTETIVSLWPRWPVLVVLCLLLSAGWFIRRAMGLV